MARGFGSNFGTGSSDKITGPITGTQQNQIAISQWVIFHGKGSSGFGIPFGLNKTVNGAGLFNYLCNNSATQMIIGVGFSTTGGQWTFPVAVSTAWQHWVITYDGSSTSNKPTVYINGSPVTVTTATTPVGTLTTGFQQICIGGTTGVTTWDGVIAETAFWNGALLTAAEVTALYNRTPAFLIKPASLYLYAPLFGLQTNEQDWGPNRIALTVSGAKQKNHAPVSLWTQPATIAPVYKFAGSLALAQGASSTAITLREKFTAAAAALQPASATAITAREKFAGSVAAAAPANLTSIFGLAILPTHPGKVLIGDAAQGGLLAANDHGTSGLALADAGLYRVQLSESI